MSEAYQTVRLDHLFDEVKVKIALTTTELLTPSTVYGVIPQSQLPHRPHQASRDDFEVHPAKEGDFVISMSSYQSGFEYCGQVGGISPDYTLLRPRFHRNIGRFLRYSLKSDYLIQELTLFRNGIRQGQRLQWNRVRYLTIPVPDVDHAKVVADFLDQETGRIDQLIQKKESLMQGFSPRLEALIASAISDETLPRVRFEHLSKRMQRSVNLSDHDELVRLGLFNRGRGIFKKPAENEDGMGDSHFYLVEDGDLIFSGQFSWEGAVSQAGPEESGCVVSHRYPVYRGKDISTSYLLAFFRSKYGDFVLNDASRGSAGRNRPLNTWRLGKEKLPVPNKCLLDQIDNTVNAEARLRTVHMKSINRLREYRAALITAAVTGQIDVETYGKAGTTSATSDKIEEDLQS